MLCSAWETGILLLVVGQQVVPAGEEQVHGGAALRQNAKEAALPEFVSIRRVK
jgi:hypothetical protein